MSTQQREDCYEIIAKTRLEHMIFCITRGSKDRENSHVIRRNDEPFPLNSIKSKMSKICQLNISVSAPNYTFFRPYFQRVA